MQNIEQMGNQMPDYRGRIAEAYDKPVVRPVINRMENLESQYLPTMFEALGGGTSASDVSPAARLANVGRQLGRLTAGSNAAGNVLNFYGNQVDNLANRAAQDYQQRMNTQMFLAQMAQQREEGARNRAAQPQVNFEDIINRIKDQLGVTDDTPQSAEVEITSTDDLNNLRQAKGREKIKDPNYFERVYEPREFDYRGNLRDFHLNVGEKLGLNDYVKDQDLYTFLPEGTYGISPYYSYEPTVGSNRIGY